MSRVVVHQPATARVPELSQGSVLRSVIVYKDRITTCMVPHSTLSDNVRGRCRLGSPKKTPGLSCIAFSHRRVLLQFNERWEAAVCNGL